MTNGLNNKISGIAGRSGFLHYLSVTAVTVFLFAAWICIDIYFGRADRLDVFAAEFGNTSFLNAGNNKSFESVSFYINEPVFITLREQEGVSAPEKEFIDQIGVMSFFEGESIVEPEIIEGVEDDSTVSEKAESSLNDKTLPEPKIVDNKVETALAPVTVNENGIPGDVREDVPVKEESLENEQLVNSKPETKPDKIKVKLDAPPKSADIVSDKLKETQKYADSIEKRKRQAYMLFLKGRIEAEKGNSETAIEMLEKAKKGDPHEPELLYYLGICYCRTGDYEKGVENLEASYDLIIDPNILIPIKNAYFMLGLKQAKSQNYRLGTKSFSRVIEIDPDDGKPFFNRGICYIALENYDQALSDFDNAEAKGFTCMELKLNRAVAFEKTGETPKAISEYKIILHEQPLYAPAHYNIAVLLEQKVIDTGEYDRYASDAIYHYKRALELDRGFYEASFNISRIYYAMGDVTMSIKWLKRCIELNSNFPEAHLFLAKLYLEKGAYNNALAQVELMEKLGYDFKELNQMREEIFQICGIKEIDDE